MMRAEAREDVEHEDDNTDADDVWLAQRISLYAIAQKHIISEVSIHAQQEIDVTSLFNRLFCNDGPALLCEDNVASFMRKLVKCMPHSQLEENIKHQVPPMYRTWMIGHMRLALHTVRRTQYINITKTFMHHAKSREFRKFDPEHSTRMAGSGVPRLESPVTF